MYMYMYITFFGFLYKQTGSKYLKKKHGFINWTIIPLVSYSQKKKLEGLQVEILQYQIHRACHNCNKTIKVFRPKSYYMASRFHLGVVPMLVRTPYPPQSLSNSIDNFVKWRPESEEPSTIRNASM